MQPSSLSHQPSLGADNFCSRDLEIRYFARPRPREGALQGDCPKKRLF
jgi:hypothetical protein